MDYKVIISEQAADKLDTFLDYLINEKHNYQAASNLLDDFDSTITRLRFAAGILPFCENVKLKEYGYKRLRLANHRYFLLFRIEENLAIVDGIFHELQDYENAIK